MKKTIENFEKVEKFLFNLLLGSYVVNMLVLSVIILSDGNVSLWLMVLIVPVGLYYVAVFVIYIYRLIVYYNAKPKLEVQIWRTIVGILISPLGLLFTFFNYMVIVLVNIW